MGIYIITMLIKKFKLISNYKCKWTCNVIFFFKEKESTSTSEDEDERVD